MLPVECFDESLNLTSVVFGGYFGLFQTLAEVIVPLPQVFDE